MGWSGMLCTSFRTSRNGETGRDMEGQLRTPGRCWNVSFQRCKYRSVPQGYCFLENLIHLQYLLYAALGFSGGKTLHHLNSLCSLHFAKEGCYKHRLLPPPFHRSILKQVRMGVQKDGAGTLHGMNLIL